MDELGRRGSKSPERMPAIPEFRRQFVDKALGDKIPEFNRQVVADEPGIAQLSSFGLGGSRTHLETAVIALVAVVIIGGG